MRYWLRYSRSTSFIRHWKILGTQDTPYGIGSDLMWCWMSSSTHCPYVCAPEYTHSADQGWWICAKRAAVLMQWGWEVEDKGISVWCCSGHGGQYCSGHGGQYGVSSYPLSSPWRRNPLRLEMLMVLCNLAPAPPLHTLPSLTTWILKEGKSYCVAVWFRGGGKW